MRKVVANIYTTINIIFMLWFVVSGIEVICKNMTPNPDYSSLNLIMMLFGM